MEQQQATPNVLGSGITVLGALGAGIAVFLPLIQAPGILPVDDNTLVQNNPGAAVIVGVLVFAALSAAYEYHQSGWAGVRAIVAGAVLLAIAVAIGSDDSLYELTTYGDGGDFLPDSIDGKPGIATYVLGAAGLATASGGFVMRSNRNELLTDEPEVEDAPAVETAFSGWDVDPRDPTVERWREGDRWTGATRPRGRE